MAAYTDYPQSGNIQGYWKLNEESGERADSGPNGNDLTDNNTVLYNSDFLAGTKCADFEASNSEYLSITDGDQTGLDITGEISIACWIKRERDGLFYDTLIAKTDDSANYSYYVRTRYDWDKIQFYLSPDGGGGSGVAAFSNMEINAGTWHHICCTLNQTTDLMQVYVDGTADGSSASYTGNIYNSTSSFAIGAGFISGSPHQFFDGEIAEAVVWNTCLTPAEVKEAMEVWRPV